MKIAGSTFVVTGAGDGIGRKVAQCLVASGASVAAWDVNPAGLARTEAEVGAAAGALRTYTVDVTDAKSVSEAADRAVAEFGCVDGLVNCAGIVQRFVPIAQLSPAEMKRILDVNFWGVVHVTTSLLPHLLTRPAAAICNVSSMGALVPFPGQSLYGASKAAVKLLSDGLRAELLDTSIAVTTVFPGAIATDIAKNSGVALARSPQQEAAARMTSATDAARRIVAALQAGRPRVLIGRDAVLLDALARLVPVRSVALIARRMRSLIE